MAHRPVAVRRPSAETPAAITTAWEATRDPLPALSPPTRASQYVASRNTSGNAWADRSRVLNTATSTSGSAQILEISNFEIPDSAPPRDHQVSTFLVETRCT